MAEPTVADLRASHTPGCKCDKVSCRLRNIADKLAETGQQFQAAALHNIAADAAKLEKALAGARSQAEEYANRLCEENLI